MFGSDLLIVLREKNPTSSSAWSAAEVRVCGHQDLERIPGVKLAAPFDIAR